MTDITFRSRSAFAENTTLTAVSTLAKAAVEVMREWRRRSRSRRELAMYSYFERNDIKGAVDVDVEIAKSFW